MRVVFTPWPNPAHLYPIVPLAWALQAAGHEVRIASHAALADTTSQVGLAAVALGDPGVTPIGPGNPWPEARERKFDRITDALGLGQDERENWDIFYQFMLPSMWDFQPYGASSSDAHPELDQLVAFAKDWQPDLVLWDPCLPIGAVAAKACGAAHGRMLWGLDYFAWSMDRFADRAASGAPMPEENPLVETMRPGAERHGVELGDELLLGQWTVDPTPAGMRLPTTARSIPMRWEPFSAQVAMPDWLTRPPERPRVGITLGLSQRMFFNDGWDHVPKLLEAVAGLDIEVVATLDANQLSQVPSLPDNVRAVDYVPLNQLLPTCSALIHQGGMGTCAAATALKVPQLVIDFDVDNGTTVVQDGDAETLATEKHTESAVTASFVTEHGAGVPFDIRQPVEEMQKQLTRVLDDPAFAQGAADIYADTLAAPTTTEIVPALERLAGHYRERR